MYALVNTSYLEEKYICWMQFPSEMDERMNTKVSHILKEERSDGVKKVNDVSKNEERKGQQQLQQYQQVDMGKSIKSFSESVKQFHRKYPESEHVLTRLNIEEVINDLDEENIKSLYKLLPEN